MRQLATVFLLIFGVMILTSTHSAASIKGGINYSIPIYYDNLDEKTLQAKGKIYFYNALKTQDGTVNDDMTQALNIYAILQKKNPENPEYSVKLGRLYDKLGKDRYAKGNFSCAIGINSANPDSYFYFGEYYYKRSLYRKALKYYNQAYKYGYEKNYDLLAKMGDIYEKFGDTRSALKYLKEAYKQSPNSELSEKIKQIEAQDSINKTYYRDTRIRNAE